MFQLNSILIWNNYILKLRSPKYKPWILNSNPESWIMNPKLWTINLEPWTINWNSNLNHEPWTLNLETEPWIQPKFRTMNHSGQDRVGLSPCLVWKLTRSWPTNLARDSVLWHESEFYVFLLTNYQFNHYQYFLIYNLS